MLGISFSTPLKRSEKAIKPFFVLEIIGGLTIYGMIFPFVFADIVTIIFQEIICNIYGTPKVRRRDYLNFSRAKLPKINILQKIGCIYCDYANGVVAWIKAVVNLNFEMKVQLEEEQVQNYDITI